MPRRKTGTIGRSGQTLAGRCKVAENSYNQLQSLRRWFGQGSMVPSFSSVMKEFFVREVPVTLLLTALLLIGAGFAADDEGEKPSQPLYHGLPFDHLTLTSYYNGASFDIRPLEFDNGRRPNPLPRNGDLVICFVNNPLKEYTVKWAFVESIELFCELVFKEFRQRLDDVVEKTRSLTPDDANWTSLGTSYEELYDYLLYLEDYKDELSPQLQGTYEKFLFEEAVYRIKSDDHATGLSRFETLFRVNKDYPGLSRAWGTALDLTFQERSREAEFSKARQQLDRFKEFYPDHSVIKDWEERIRSAGRDRLAQSREAAAAKDFLTAHFLCEEAINIAPELDGIDAWRQQLQQNALRINVAVQNPSDEARLADWGTARRRPLFQRTLSEYIQPSAEGGIYASPFGTLEKTDRNRTLRWKLATDRNAFAVADTLLRLAQTERTLWNELLASVDITAADELVVRLSRPHILPEAIFDVAVQQATRFAVPWRAENGVRDSGFESPRIPNPKSRIPYWGFQRNSDTASGPRTIVEYTVDRSEDAIALLQAGKVDIIDRVAPWELERLQRNPSLTTGRYAVPTLYFLVPNLHKPLSGIRTFRRALLYGLNREAMLEKFVSKGVDATIVSGPFLRGASLDDPLGYAYDTAIAPRPYEPKLAIALAQLALGQAKAKNEELDETSKVPQIVLARPVHETALFVSLMVRRQWEAIGIPVREVEFRPNEQIGQGTDVDFWLVERTIKEPLVDAEALFGHSGLLGGGSTYMELALEKLRLAEDWPTAAKRLQEIHRLCFEETTVLPLWQISEHFVHREGISGIRSDPPILNLYQNIDRWNLSANR